MKDRVETLISAKLDEVVRIQGHRRKRVRECLLGWFDYLWPAYQDEDVDQVCTMALQMPQIGDSGT